MHTLKANTNIITPHRLSTGCTEKKPENSWKERKQVNLWIVMKLINNCNVITEFQNMILYSACSWKK